jgi:hypothetical protein
MHVGCENTGVILDPACSRANTDSRNALQQIAAEPACYMIKIQYGPEAIIPTVSLIPKKI